MRHTISELQALIAEHATQLCGTATPSMVCLGGHASYRIYFRAQHAERSFVIMELGEDRMGSEEVTAGAAPAELPFLEVQRYLAAGGIAVPQVLGYLEQPGLILLEDLGDHSLESVVLPLPEIAREPFYRQAVRDLIALQRYTTEEPHPHCQCFQRRFDRDLLRWELDHFREWLLEAHRGRALSPAERHVVEASFDRVADELAALPAIWVHRDFQSRNLMVQRSAEGVHLRLIDFQDALLGPPPYDLVALLRDSYVDLGLPLVERLLQLYLDESDQPLSVELFRRSFWLQSLQRKLKDAGRFVFIDRVKSNPSFLRHIPLSLQYVAQALERLGDLHDLRQVLAAHLPELDA